MSLLVISTDLTDRGGKVTIEGETQEAVMAPAAKQMAIKAASAAVSRAGISGNGYAYPVDAEGNHDEDLVLGRRGPVAKYRCDYSIAGGL